MKALKRLLVKFSQYNNFTNQYRCITTRDRLKLYTSYWHEKGNFSFVNLTVGELIDKAADNYGDDTAFVLPFQNVQKTYSQLKNDVNQLAAGFINLDLQKGDKLAVWSPNSYECVISQLAAAKAGLILVTINPAYKSLELEYALQKMKCQSIVSAEKFKTQNFYQILCDVIPEISNSKTGQIHSQKMKSLKNVIMFGDENLPGTYNLKEVMKGNGSESQKLLNERKKIINFDDPYSVMFTSGTTGTPKASTSSHFNLINSVLSLNRKLKLDQDNPVICLQVPLFHAFGFVFGTLLTLITKVKTVIPSEHFDACSSLKTIEQERCSIVYGTPTMFVDILQQLSCSEYDISSWKKVLVGGASVPVELIKQLDERLGLVVMNAYGSTEISGAATSTDITDKRGSSGTVVEHTEVKIIDKEGNTVPVNTKGELLIRNNYTFLGYWDDKEKTDEVIDNAKWYHSGDIGIMDEDGYVFITGRIKDMVIRGGENIYPQEIENLLLSHPAIVEAYIVGVPDPRMGEELCACIYLKANENVSDQDIKNFCKGKISHFKIPRYIIFRKEFPKTGSGKIQKYILQEECIKLLKL